MRQAKVGYLHFGATLTALRGISDSLLVNGVTAELVA
jgi:hypothetical protein